MNVCALVACCLLVASCAGPRTGVEPDTAFHDAWFAPPSQPVSAADVFTLSPAMRQFLLDDRLARQLRTDGLQRGLVMALYRQDQLRLDYDASSTRNAAEAFAARRGNCLSLVLMTAAFAKELDLQVTYQRVAQAESWTLLDDITYVSGHVNLVLERGRSGALRDWDPERLLTVDFLPAADIKGQHVSPIDERTLLGMYMNNRAAEALAAGRIDDAYWWARGGVLQAHDLTAARNTLGIVYLRTRHAAAAVDVFAAIVAREPDQPQALSNLVLALRQAGRGAEAAAVRAHLAEVERQAPFAWLRLGLAALGRGENDLARSQFEQEIDHGIDGSQVHYWLGVAQARLGHLDEARRQVLLASKTATRPDELAIYEGKLARLSAAGAH